VHTGDPGLEVPWLTRWVEPAQVPRPGRGPPRLEFITDFRGDLRSAKQEFTRGRRTAQLIECSAAGELEPNQRYGDTSRWVEQAAAAAAAAQPPT
jgi:hypothetical protein